MAEWVTVIEKMSPYPRGSMLEKISYIQTLPKYSEAFLNTSEEVLELTFSD